MNLEEHFIFDDLDAPSKIMPYFLSFVCGLFIADQKDSFLLMFLLPILGIVSVRFFRKRMKKLSLNQYLYKCGLYRPKVKVPPSFVKIFLG